MRSAKWLTILSLIFLTVGCANATHEAEMQKTEIIFLQIGQADAIVLLFGEHVVLIDSGERNDGEVILRFLSERKINALDLMIITHFDKDHVGGADAILMGMPVQAVYDANYEPNTKHYRAYTEAIKASGVPRYRVSKEITLAIGDLSITLQPTAMRDADGNDQSLAVIIKDSWHQFFFAGDAEKARLDELLQAGLQKADLVKMPHHGRYHKNLPEFLTTLDASIAVITDSLKKPAEEETLSLLDEMGIQSYQTANGDIHVMSGKDGFSVLQKEWLFVLE